VLDLWKSSHKISFQRVMSVEYANSSCVLEENTLLIVHKNNGRSITGEGKVLQRDYYGFRKINQTPNVR
jgi:hypothetical protein